jgi:GAG-pre-integrase domain
LLITRDGTHVAQGSKIANNLYKLDVSVRCPQNGNETTTPSYVFSTSVQTQSWETWHRRFGHVGYTGLQKLLDDELVDGFTVDTSSPKPDCIACTEAKQSVEPFNAVSHRTTEPGELTHMDLWGKYDVTSIHGHQYYILFVDDSA